MVGPGGRRIVIDPIEASNGGGRVSAYDAEWWHFDYNDWRQYPIGNVTFDRVEKKE